MLSDRVGPDGTGGLAESSKQAVALLFEGGTIRLGYGRAPANLDPPRVLGHPVHSELVVEVRAAGQASGADIPDDLSLLDPRATTDLPRYSTEMPIASRDSVEVAKLDKIAIPTYPPGSEHNPVARRHDRRSGPSRVVGAFMPAGATEHGMKPPVGKVGGNPAKFDRSAQEGSPERATIGIEEQGAS